MVSHFPNYKNQNYTFLVFLVWANEKSERTWPFLSQISCLDGAAWKSIKSARFANAMRENVKSVLTKVVKQ